jgi:membrane protease YdiL (CAAX protease family)
MNEQPIDAAASANRQLPEFRGYMQQRLVDRWGPAIGIVVTSIVFGIVHVMPHSIAAAMPLGFWFGYVAWRSGSIFPAMLCHFFVNAGLNA